MNNKHTPGPWTLGLIGNTRGKSDQPDLIGVEGFGGTALVLHANFSHPEALANAHLIAAAPELLDWAKRSRYLLTSFNQLTPEGRKKVYAELEVLMVKTEGKIHE